MKYEQSIREGKLLKRYKRFFADIEFEGKTIRAHVPNSGSMKGCSDPNSLCRFTSINNPKRKLQYTLEMVKTPTSWVGVNTLKPNVLVHELWSNRARMGWRMFDRIQREVRISDLSRVDLVMWSSRRHKAEKLQRPNFSQLKGPFHFVEVKNVSMAESGVAQFPDAVTLRGQRHIDELLKLSALGHTCELVFVIQREDCEMFSPADLIDPEYGRKLRRAAKEGIKITALACALTKNGIQLLADDVPVKL